ncbi:MAG: imidazole glycerol phosphate synthase subunit HisH [Acidimicrobiia bacterium]|nr:imidazole glycerol phosphate synthase subunit HisH [Acidimicrobiia bacterium]
MQRVAVVDYGLNNLDSVCRALEECGAAAFVTDSPADVERADRIVLPGVGAFPDAMANLRERGLVDALTEEVQGHGAPFLGICLGMQLLATRSHEVAATDGLGWIPGEVRRLEPTAADRRVPHMGWNEVDPVGTADLFAGIAPRSDFYFVHSFRLCCDDDADVLATTPYCGGFTSAVHRGSVFGVQFHPEKSQAHGFELLRNFLEWSC